MTRFIGLDPGLHVAAVLRPSMPEEPRRRGRPPKVMAADATPDRLSQLTAREKALAIKSKARHRYTLDLPLDLYEQLLDEAERYDTSVPDVFRSCLSTGLKHIRQFGSAASAGANPHIYGQLNPPTQAQIDPTGMAWPPTGATLGLIQPAIHFDQPSPLPLRQDLPPQMAIKIRPGMLPNGYTDNFQVEAQSYTGDAYQGPSVFGDHDPE